MSDKNEHEKLILARAAVWIQEDPAKRSWSKLAGIIGKSPAAVSQVRKGMYKGDSYKIIGAVEDFLMLQKKRTAINIEPDFTETRQARQILTLISNTRVMRSIGVIASSAGIGKTTTLKKYAAMTSGVFYLQADPFMRSQIQFLQILCRMFDVSGYYDNRAQAFEKLKEKASMQGALIIIDDAQTLVSPNARNSTIFEIIRILNDGGVGIVLAGNRKLRARVTGTEDEEFYQQLASRSEILDLPEKFSREDVNDICLNLVGHKLLESNIDYLHALANDCIGSLRVMVRVLAMAVLRHQAQGGIGDLTLRHLQDAAKLKVSQLKNPVKRFGKEKVNVKTNGGNHSQPPEGTQTSLSATA